MIAAAEATAAALVDAGIGRAYTVPGESFLALLHAIEQSPEIRLVSTRHESGASFMADADAKLTGVPAVVMASRGPGAANLAIGVHTARQDSTPMVVLLGQVPRGSLGRESFQEVDLQAFYQPITKWCVTATVPGRLPALVSEAARVAVTGRPGPVAVVVPADVGDAQLEQASGSFGGAAKGSSHLPGAGAPSSEALRALAARLSAARCPVVIAGAGARFAVETLVAVAERFDLGVYAAFRRQDVFPNDHPNYLGHLGLGAPGEICATLERADLVLALGTRLSEVTTQSYRLPSPDCPVVQVDRDPGILGMGRRGVAGIVADVPEMLVALMREAPAPASGVRRTVWDAGHEAWAASTEVPPGGAPGSVDPAAAVAALGRHLPPGAVVANDAGNFAAFLHRHLWYRSPLSQLAPTSGAMGYGVPAAVGAALAAPGRRVAAVVGDGGLLMTGQELETAVRLRQAPLVVVFRNGLYGTIAMHQMGAFGSLAGAEIGRVDVAAWAGAFGAQAWTVTETDQVDDAVVDALACQAPAVVELVTDPEQLAPGVRRPLSRPPE